MCGNGLVEQGEDCDCGSPAVSFTVGRFIEPSVRLCHTRRPICSPKIQFSSSEGVCVSSRSAPEKEGPAVTSARLPKAPSAATGSAATIARYAAFHTAVVASPPRERAA